MTPENWDLVEIDDGTYYIAEYIGILDKAGRTEEETEAVKAFAEWFGSAETQAAWGEEFDSYPCNTAAADILYPDGIPAIYTLKNFALTKVDGTDMTYAEYVAEHSSEWTNIMTNLGLLGRRLRRRGGARLGQPRLGDPDPEGRVRQAPRTASRGEAQQGYRLLCVFRRAGDLSGSPDLFIPNTKRGESIMIRLNDIVVKFGDFTALHSINVHVKEGEFFTFLGPSGCGKTTTLRTITGFIEPAEGSVVVKGPRHHARPHRGPQHRHRVPELRALPDDDRIRQHRLRPQGQEGKERTRSTARCARSRARSTFPTSS